eukprot:m.22308 g.22308  ORF g.22308 m.22308 type:complete len:267 (+) comp12896_c0_seq1:567-1367(+)
MNNLLRQFHFDRIQRLEKKATAQAITLAQNITLKLYALPGAHLGSHQWPGGRILAEFLADIKNASALGCENNLHQLKFLELGAGLGLPSLVAAKQGAQKVLVTDVDTVLPLIQRNIEENNLPGHQITCRALDWTSIQSDWLENNGNGSRGREDKNRDTSGDDENNNSHDKEDNNDKNDTNTTFVYNLRNSFDVILGADVVYRQEFFVPLLNTLRWVSAPIVLLAYKQRDPCERQFFEQAEQYFDFNELARVGENVLFKLEERKKKK